MPPTLRRMPADGLIPLSQALHRPQDRPQYGWGGTHSRQRSLSERGSAERIEAAHRDFEEAEAERVETRCRGQFR